MTVSTEQVAASYTGDGVSVSFTYPGEFDTAGELLVTRIDLAGGAKILQLNVDYTISGGDGGTGTVVLTSADVLPSGYKLDIERNTSQLQPDKFTANQGFPAATIEKRFDRLARSVQELQEQVNRALTLPRGDGVLGALPRSSRAQRALIFDDAGRPGYGQLSSTALFTTAFTEDFLLAGDALDARSRINAQEYMAPTAAGIALVQQASIQDIRTYLGLQAKVSIFVTDFGAVGDGVTDCTLAFTSAFAAAAALGGAAVIVPPGDWLIADEAYCVGHNIQLVGYGPGATRLLNGSTDSAIIRWGATGQASTPSWWGNACIGLSVAQKPEVTPTAGNMGLFIASQGRFRLYDVEHRPYETRAAKLREVVLAQECQEIRVRDAGLDDATNRGIAFKNCVGIYAQASTAHGAGSYGWVWDDCDGGFADSLQAYGCGTYGCLVTDDTSARVSRNLAFTKCTFGGSGVANMHVDDVRGMQINSCLFFERKSGVATAIDGLLLDGVNVKDVTIIGGSALSNTGGNGIHLKNGGSSGTAPALIQIIGFQFGSNSAVGLGNTTGLLVDAGVTGQAIGGSAKGNTTAVTNNSGGSFTTSSIIT